MDNPIRHRISYTTQGKVVEMELRVSMRDETEEERRASREQDDELLGPEEAARFHGESE